MDDSSESASAATTFHDDEYTTKSDESSESIGKKIRGCIQLIFGDETVETFEYPNSLKDMKRLIRKIFKVSHIKIKYSKSKSELISISNDQDLLNALEDNKEIGHISRFLIFQRRDEEGYSASTISKRNNRVLALQDETKTKKRPASLHIPQITEQPIVVNTTTPWTTGTKNFSTFTSLLDLQTEEGILLRKRATVRERSATTSLTTS